MGSSLRSELVLIPSDKQELDCFTVPINSNLTLQLCHTSFSSTSLHMEGSAWGLHRVGEGGLVSDSCWEVILWRLRRGGEGAPTTKRR